MKIEGLTVTIKDPRGRTIVFSEGQEGITLGELIYGMAAKDFKDQTEAEAMMGFRIQKKLAIPCDFVELTSEEITLLKKIACKGPKLLYGILYEALEAGGLKPEAEEAEERVL